MLILLYFSGEVSNYSKKCTKNGNIDNKYLKKEVMIEELNRKIESLVERWMENQRLKYLEDCSGK